MHKYVDQGYVSKVPPELLNIADQYYFLNHHGVYKRAPRNFGLSLTLPRSIVKGAWTTPC